MKDTKIDYMLDIFRALTTELPEQMLYRENGDSIELGTIDSDSNRMPGNNGWTLIGCQVNGAAA